MSAIIVLLTLLLLFALVGIIYPTPLHKKIAYKQVDLGKRVWNAALFVLCFILIGILAPSQPQPVEDTAKAEIEAELDKAKKQLAKNNEQLKQLKQLQQQNEELKKSKQDLEAKLKACEEEKKKLQEEITKKENELKAAEEEKKQQTTTSSSSSSSSNDSPSTESRSSSVYYANCSEARAAGAAPIYAGEPGYAKKLDRDGDGVACE
ncbi:excalibur calcium-binding domain-containing protein [Laceyella putida]|uniref:Excalibur calcium-binding domain-containing protein n=1 Tax=Laceyella putida TaxID=110101 RepID=A0ABW2RFH2_9BACL